MSDALVRQQQEFAAAVRAARPPESGLLQDTPAGEPARFHIYQNAYRIRMVEALKENYPVLASVLGDDEFAGFAAGFLQTCPSQTASIRWFGAQLADYVAAHPDTLPHPALLDLIRMEWALSVAFDSPDAKPLTVADLAAVAPESWPGLSFVVHPSVQLIHVDWNVEPIWTALAADPDAATDAPEAAPHYLLVWRAGHVNYWRSVSDEEAGLLTALMQGSNFGDLCDLCGQQLNSGQSDNAGTAAVTVAGYLRTWVDATLLLPLD